MKIPLSKLWILRGDYPGLSGWVLNPKTSVLRGDGRGKDTKNKRRPHEGGGQLRVTQSQAKELLEPPGAEGGRRGVSPRTPKGGGSPRTP